MSKAISVRRRNSIERRLSKRIDQPAIPIGPELRDLLADWSCWMEGRGVSASTSDWFVQFLKWAVKGRAKGFVEWAKAHPGRASRRALAGIQQVYDFHWPHRVSVGYIFHDLWGWLQLELEKPGERNPATIIEQMEALQKHAEEQGTPIKNFEILGGGVFAAMEEIES